MFLFKLKGDLKDHRRTMSVIEGTYIKCPYFPNCLFVIIHW